MASARADEARMPGTRATRATECCVEPEPEVYGRGRGSCGCPQAQPAVRMRRLIKTLWTSEMTKRVTARPSETNHC